MTKTTLIREAFNWGWLTGSEVQSIMIKAEAWQCPGRHGGGGDESLKSCSFFILQNHPNENNDD